VVVRCAGLAAHGLGMGLHGIVGAVVIPYAVAWWF